MNNNKDLLKLKKSLLTLTFISLGVSSFGCAKNVDCDINDEHVHIYIDEENNLEKYILGEKDHKDDFVRTDSYVLLDEEIKKICENDLLVVSDNIDYISKTIDSYEPYREEYAYDYRYGYYYGYDSLNGEYGYVCGWHWDYDWDQIPLDEYTTEKVRDITYNYKFYKINDNGELEYKYFNSLDNLDEEYKYFKVSDLVNKNIGESYYLEKNKTYKNVK